MDKLIDRILERINNNRFLVILKPIGRFFYKKLKKRHNHRKCKWMEYQMHKMIDPCTEKRQKYWIKCGAHISGQINIGNDVWFDAINAEYITIEDGAWITSRCLLLCHQRDLSKYSAGKDINKMPYIKAPIHIGKGVHVGMGTTIMPGVTIGEGAIIGAGSLITKDIPPYSLALGRPAKVLKTFDNSTDHLKA